MIKRFMILGMLSFSCIAICQEKKEDSNLIEKQREDLLLKISQHPFKKELDSPKKLPNGKLPPDLYFKDRYLRTIDPATGEVPAYKLAEIRQDVKSGMYTSDEEFSLLRLPGSQEDAWVNRGPYNVGGRTRAIMFDPNDPTGKKVFAGGASGGLWVNNDITNANSEWQPIGDLWAETSISCIAHDPNNPMTFYVGTGEVYTNDATGLGIFKTTDGGQTWEHVFNDTFGYTENGRLRGNYYITDIEVRDNNGQSEVFVGVSGRRVTDGVLIANYEAGLYKSTDGVNFNRIEDLYFGPSTSTGLDYHHSVNKIEIGADNSVWVSTKDDPFNSTVIGGKIYKSTDGTNFSLVYQESTSTEKGRVELATSSQNPNIAYALIQTLISSAPVKIIKTTDGGETWTEKTLPSDADTGIPASDFTRGQSFYDLEIAVDPTNDSHVYVGGIDLFRSTNGGESWNQISKWSNNNALGGLNVSYVHADQHAIVFNPQNQSQMLFGCDGGIFFAPDNTSFESSSSVTPILARNTGYNITQFYSAKMNPTSTRENEEIIAGAQDNGTIVLQGVPNDQGILNNFTYTGGDGALVEYDDNADYLINGYVYSYHYLTNLNNNNLFYLLPSSERDNGSFINPITLDPIQDVAFANRSGISFNVISGLQGANSTNQLDLFQYSIDSNNGITKLRVSPYTTSSTTLFVGTYDGRIFKVENANLENTASHSQLNTTIVGSISDIQLGLSENEILATVSNYNVNNIWYTNDGGSTWQEKDGNFPDMPVRSIIMNPNNNNEVMIGTDLGVWATSNFQDPNPTWSTSNNGLANVSVTEFDYRESDGTVMAVTYGRGVFTTNQNSFLGTENVGSRLSNFVVYPQPSKGDLNIMFDEVDRVDIKIFNTEGKLVYEQKKVSSKETFNVGLPTGVYILEATGENNFKKHVNVMMK